MRTDAFSHVTTWVFDLDRTLYPPAADLFGLMNPRIISWITDTLNVTEAEAGRLRVQYWQQYGTTLSGLMREHGLDPAAYLTHIHDIPLDRLAPDPALAAHIRALPGRRIVFTNACAAYAERVLAARGLSGLFDATYGVEHAGFKPKPERGAYDAIIAQDGLSPTSAAMFEDDERNLIEPHSMGMATVHVAPERGAGPHIHHHTDDLTGFLSQVIDGTLCAAQRTSDIPS
ncbi:pyrimidine 5'-nucleotidase [Oceaniglobus ichthyenteri]|uniref:pyrimidine 5'-nucleotidase n=1 Tax=Oceaniglobus ichthyenteri TaxID=2136177 RepID=UPI000D33A1B0|nr:pyrimidine 5'-nucleotidase [Oceaniglobus ichthyenteri]